jgi:hypothetical protein
LWGYVQYDIWKTDAYLVLANGSERPALRWLRIYVATPAVVSPVGATNQPRDVFLVWRKSAPATSYRVQVAADSTFSTVVVDSIVVDTSLHVNPLAANSTFFWRVCALNTDGSSAFSSISNFTTGTQVSAVEKAPGMPNDFELSQNYPNPFNPSTTIRFSLPRNARISLVLYNNLGQQMEVLAEGEYSAGTHDVRVDGSILPSGIYFYELRSEQFTAIKKLVLLK